MKKLKFIKEDNKWYIDLPLELEEGLFTKADLQMVAGADDLLEHISGGHSCVELSCSEEFIPNWDWCIIQKEPIVNKYAGCTYTSTDRNGDFSTQLWLCPVTLHLFNDEYPQQLFIKL